MKQVEPFAPASFMSFSAIKERDVFCGGRPQKYNVRSLPSIGQQNDSELLLRMQEAECIFMVPKKAPFQHSVGNKPVEKRRLPKSNSSQEFGARRERRQR